MTIDLRPTHLLPRPSAADTLCGQPRETGPTVWVKFAQAHIDGRCMSVCPECITITGWWCRRCGHIEHGPELFSVFEALTVDACTRCANTPPEVSP